MVSNLCMYKIDKYIYICDRQKATDYEALEENNIKAMLYLNHITKINSVLSEYTELGIHHYHLPIKDSLDPGNEPDFEPFFMRIVNIIKHFSLKNLNILIYCDTGTRLAPIGAITYLLYKNYIIDKILLKQSNMLLPKLLDIVQKKNSEIDYKNISKVIQKLAIFEGYLKKQAKELRDQIN